MKGTKLRGWPKEGREEAQRGRLAVVWSCGTPPQTSVPNGTDEVLALGHSLEAVRYVFGAFGLVRRIPSTYFFERTWHAAAMQDVPHPFPLWLCYFESPTA